MSDTPKIHRIVHASTRYCDEHHRYHKTEADGTTACPVCRQESERDEGMDLFGAKPETTHG